MNGEPKIQWLSYISNAALLSLKFLLLVGQNIFSNNGFMICLLMKTLIFHQWFSIHNLILNTRWVKKKYLPCKIISLSTKETFFSLNDWLHISKKNSFLYLKQNKKILKNRSCRPLAMTVNCMDEWLCRYISLYQCGTRLMKN